MREIIMNEPEQLKFHFVAALRFGSTKSGYAFSSHEEFLKGWPLQINADLWNTGTLFRCIKMPTSLLLNPDESLNSFGYDAENNFTDLVEEGDHREYFYFEKFTNNLYKQIPMLSDYTGKKLATKTVFSESLRFFKNEVLAKLNESHTEVTINDVKFVFILPPTWDNQDEDFIKDAAVSGGLESKQITVALKKNILPVYLPHLIGPIKHHLEEDEELVKSLSKIMLVDVGGQRTEIRVIEQPFNINNIDAGPVVLGPYGGKRIDDEFRRFFNEVLPGMTLEELKEESLEDYIELFKEFELKKCMMTVTEPRNVSITLPIPLVELIKKSTEGMAINEWLENSPYPEVQLRRSQHLQIPSQVFENLFQPTIDNILNLMKKVFNEEQYGDIKTIVMTGGFSKCTYLQRAVIAHFQSKSLIIPRDPDLVILEGRVVYGYSSSEVEDKEEILKETMDEEKLIILYDVKKETTNVEITEEEETTDKQDKLDQKESVVSLFEYIKQKEEGNVTPVVTQTFEQQVIQAQKIIKVKPKEIKKIQDKIKQKYEYDKQGETEITAELLEEGIGVNQKDKVS
ncbi:hypothetical protein KUTeg_025031 [Tegillarca granosa]|uniref:Uncharacterized protein n=1 Tax=Tegillarca granosa TaxID=220873 RepID=A0ABQ9E4N4_TEGGR|nr:hypothetical protein KUTeg_025031 [Tegillarca granosa]